MSLTVNIRYYDADNNTGPNLEGWTACSVKDNPTATMSVDLDPSDDILNQLAKVHRAVYQIQATRSLLFSLLVPAQTRTFYALVASLLPLTSSVIASNGNAALKVVGALFALMVDLPTLAVRVITLIPRAIQQSTNDAMVGTFWRGELAGYKLKKDFMDEIDWNRGRLAIDHFRYDNQQRWENPARVYFLGY